MKAASWYEQKLLHSSRPFPVGWRPLSNMPSIPTLARFWKQWWIGIILPGGIKFWYFHNSSLCTLLCCMVPHIAVQVLCTCLWWIHQLNITTLDTGEWTQMPLYLLWAYLNTSCQFTCILQKMPRTKGSKALLKRVNDVVDLVSLNLSKKTSKVSTYLYWRFVCIIPVSVTSTSVIRKELASTKVSL